MFNFIFLSIPDFLLPGFFLFLIFGSVIFSLIRARKTEYVLYALLVWFPLENFILNFASPVWYEILKYAPEIILYAVLLGLFIKNRFHTQTNILPQSLRRPFLFFGIVAVLSLILNWYDPAVWLLGVRQIIRFVSVFLIILIAGYPESIRTNLLRIMIGMVIFQAVFGLMQYGFGGRLDNFLFPERKISIGNFAEVGGNELLWTPGTRIFATMGRYDQLGSFLVIGLILIISWIIVYQKKITPRVILAVSLITTALFLTKSRASWLAALAAITIGSYFLFKNKKIIYAISGGSIIIAVYLLGFIATHDNVWSITEKANQNLAERIIEAGSVRAWRESYAGYGRIFFIVNTPRKVVADSPFFGVGPGNYGGGAAAALGNTKVYDRLHLPFGVQNVYGQIDNSWFSLWGEFGTLGLIAVLWVFLVLMRDARNKYQETTRMETKMLASTVFGLTIALAVIGFFGPYFEFRTLMFNLWLIAGLFYVSGRQENQFFNFKK